MKGQVSGRTKSSPIRLTSVRTQNVLITVGLGLIALALAEVAAANGWVSPLILPEPSSVFAALKDGLASGVYLTHLGSTAFAAIVGFLIAAVIAFAMGATLVMIPRLETILMPYIVALQATPKIAIAPLIILWLGFDQGGKITIAVVTCFFPILITNIQGLAVRDKTLLLLFRSLGSTKTQLLWHLRVPSALPYMFAGWRIGIVFSLLGTIVAEFVGSRKGMGYILIQQKALFNVPGVFALILLLMVLGLFFDRAVAVLERKFTKWAVDIGTVAF